MCFNKQLLPKNYAKRVHHNLHDVLDPADTNIETAARGEAPHDGDIFLDQARLTATLAESLSVFPGALIDYANDMAWQHEYEKIFTYVPRRNDRAVSMPTPELAVMIRKWYNAVQKKPDLTNEIGDFANLPDEDLMLALFREHLPKKTDINSWIGAIVFDDLCKNKNIKYGHVMPWEPWMSTSADGKAACSVPPGFLTVPKSYPIPFLGTGGEGRWVWRLTKDGVPYPRDHAVRRIHEDVSVRIQSAEQDLVSLAIRIANWVAWWLVEKYIHPQVHERGRRTLTDADIVHAVVEILGDEWFELPFDDKKRLQQWKLMRSIPEMDQEFYHHVFLE